MNTTTILYVGIDVSKDKSDICIKDHFGNDLIQRFKIANNKAELVMLYETSIPTYNIVVVFICLDLIDFGLLVRSRESMSLPHPFVHKFASNMWNIYICPKRTYLCIKRMRGQQVPITGTDPKRDVCYPLDLLLCRCKNAFMFLARM